MGTWAQALLYAVYDAWWILPLAGFVVGFATNYLALLLIFKPIEPKCAPNAGSVGSCALRTEGRKAMKGAKPKNQLREDKTVSTRAQRQPTRDEKAIS